MPRLRQFQCGWQTGVAPGGKEATAAYMGAKTNRANWEGPASWQPTPHCPRMTAGHAMELKWGLGAAIYLGHGAGQGMGGEK